MARELKDGIAGYKTDVYALAVYDKVCCGDMVRWYEYIFSDRGNRVRCLKHIKDKVLMRHDDASLMI